MHVAASLMIAALNMGITILPKSLSNEADVAINVDSIHTVGLVKGKKTAYYEIDDYLHRGRNEKFYDVDRIYIPSKQYLPLYPSHTFWLPQAYEPSIHYYWSDFVPPRYYDLVFIGSDRGNDAYNYRRQVLDALEKKFKMLRGMCQPQDYPKKLSQGKLLLNVMPKMENEAPLINARVFESMAIGCLFNDYHESLDELFKKDIHYIGFSSVEDAEEKATFYLRNPLMREKIMNQGLELLQQNHTWEHRLAQILKDCEVA